MDLRSEFGRSVERMIDELSRLPQWWRLPPELDALRQQDALNRAMGIPDPILRQLDVVAAAEIERQRFAAHSALARYIDTTGFASEQMSDVAGILRYADEARRAYTRSLDAVESVHRAQEEIENIRRTARTALSTYQAVMGPVHEAQRIQEQLEQTIFGFRSLGDSMDAFGVVAMAVVDALATAPPTEADPNEMVEVPADLETLYAEHVAPRPAGGEQATPRREQSRRITRRDLFLMLIGWSITPPYDMTVAPLCRRIGDHVDSEVVQPLIEGMLGSDDQEGTGSPPEETVQPKAEPIEGGEPRPPLKGWTYEGRKPDNP